MSQCYFCTASTKVPSVYNKAKLRMESGNFRLRKWKTNDSTLRAKISETEACKHAQPQRGVNGLEVDEACAKSKLVPQDTTKGEKVLGLAWSLERDMIYFNFEHIARKNEDVEPTKRSLLSLLSSLFDPLGLISGVVVSMKILFQDVCKDKLGWGEVFNDDVKRRLDEWIKDLVATREIYIDRCLYNARLENTTEVYLHGFADASKKAYCAVVYLVYRTENGEACARLIASKTRVAPLKELSIPRLELMSARILAQLVSTIRTALSSQLKLDGVRYWLDSKTALCWIRNQGEWKQFVRHRVDEILRLTNKNEWAHVSTQENPADIGSRGVLASQLESSKLWWNGPTWILDEQSDWPSNVETHRTPESFAEEKKSAIVLTTKANQISGLGAVVDIERYSTLIRLLNVTALLRRAIYNFKRPLTK